MVTGRKSILAGVLITMMTWASGASGDVVRYVRYSDGDAVRYGIQEGDTIGELSAAPWSGGTPTGESLPLDTVTLLAPAEPSKPAAAC